MILIIDEETRRMTACKEYLEACGYNVSFIADVDEAYNYIKARQPEIEAIVLDIMMPWGTLFSIEETECGILTGYHFFQKIRRECFPMPPVIFYTALNRPEVFRDLKKESSCSVVHKPDPPSKIVTELKRRGVVPRKGLRQND